MPSLPQYLQHRLNLTLGLAPWHIHEGIIVANVTGCNSVLVAIGANLTGQMDSPLGQVGAAIDNLSETTFKSLSQSRLFRTPCFPPGTGPDFVNAAMLCETRLDPEQTLHALHAVEAAMGRERGVRWGARVIDIDLIAHGQHVLPDLAGFQHWAGLDVDSQARLVPDRLVLPHPRMQERGFVLVPLMDVAPDWVHPVLGQSVRQMHAALDSQELAEIWPVEQ